jgi:hypothetical protein
MAEDRQGASFNPDDASGLLDNARVKIGAVKVDIFTSTKGKNAGTKYVNVDVTYTGGAQEITEHYMLGGADQWAPNASKTGAIPVTEGGRVWNKSDVYKLVKSFIDAGFPKNRVSNDLSVFAGLDVHVNRVTQEGATYLDSEGKERQRTTLLVSKIYTSPADMASGAYSKAAGKVGRPAKGAATPAATANVASSEGDDANDAYATELLVEILTESGGELPKERLPQPAFIKITRAKKAAIRQAVQDRLQNDAFLNSLAEQGLIGYDGKIVSLGG